MSDLAVRTTAIPGLLMGVYLLVTASLRTMTAIWMGLARVAPEVSAGRMTLDGDPTLARSMQDWLGLSPFAGVDRKAG